MLEGELCIQNPLGEPICRKGGPFASRENNVAVVPLINPWNRKYTTMALHEVGHLMGLGHHNKGNQYSSCFMNPLREGYTFKKYISEVDNDLCQKCEKKINKLEKIITA